MAAARFAGTVLIVEDSDDVLDTLAAALRERGYRVLTAHDGVKALTLLASVPADVIVLDLGMPVMTGWEFLEARSADPLLARIPVVVISSADANGVGAWDAYVAKPFGVDQVVNAIERCRRSTRRRDTPTELPRR